MDCVERTSSARPVLMRRTAPTFASSTSCATDGAGTGQGGGRHDAAPALVFEFNAVALAFPCLATHVASRLRSPMFNPRVLMASGVSWRRLDSERTPSSASLRTGGRINTSINTCQHVLHPCDGHRRRGDADPPSPWERQAQFIHLLVQRGLVGEIEDASEKQVREHARHAE